MLFFLGGFIYLFLRYQSDVNKDGRQASAPVWWGGRKNIQDFSAAASSRQFVSPPGIESIGSVLVSLDQSKPRPMEAVVENLKAAAARGSFWLHVVHLCPQSSAAIVDWSAEVFSPLLGAGRLRVNSRKHIMSVHLFPFLARKVLD